MLYPSLCQPFKSWLTEDFFSIWRLGVWIGLQRGVSFHRYTLACCQPNVLNNSFCTHYHCLFFVPWHLPPTSFYYSNLDHIKVKSSLTNSLFVQVFTFKLNFLGVSCLLKETKQTEYIFAPKGSQRQGHIMRWFDPSLSGSWRSKNYDHQKL